MGDARVGAGVGENGTIEPQEGPGALESRPPPPPTGAAHAACCAPITEGEGLSRYHTLMSIVGPVLGVPNVGVPSLDGAGSGALPFPLSRGWAVGFPGEGLVCNCSSANLQRSSLLLPRDKK